MHALIRSNRHQLERDLRGTDRLWKFSAAPYVLFRDHLPDIRRYVSGRLLDVGCGAMPLKRFLTDRFEVYDGLDIERRSPETKFICDAQDMKPIPDASYDTVLSVAALEHMPFPWRGFSEIARVTKPGGHVIILVPHLSRYHEEPHDFYRFTSYGLTELGRLNGLEVVEVKPVGGLFSFLAHQVSTIVLGLVWHISLLRGPVFWLNYIFFVRGPIMLDGALRTRRLFPMDILAVYRKPSAPVGAVDRDAQSRPEGPCSPTAPAPGRTIAGQ